MNFWACLKLLAYNNDLYSDTSCSKQNKTMPIWGIKANSINRFGPSWYLVQVMASNLDFIPRDMGFFWFFFSVSYHCIITVFWGKRREINSSILSIILCLVQGLAYLRVSTLMGLLPVSILWLHLLYSLVSKSLVSSLNFRVVIFMLMIHRKPSSLPKP